MSKDTLDDILGVTTEDVDSESFASTDASDIAESAKSKADITDAETYSDGISESAINEDEIKTSGEEITSIDTDADKGDVDADVHEIENTDKLSYIFLRKAVPLYRVPNSKSVITMVSGRVTVTGKAKGNFLPVQFTRYGVGKLTGYIISHREGI